MKRLVLVSMILLMAFRGADMSARSLAGCVRTSNGEAMENVAVSDGVSVVVTDEDGKYSLDVDENSRFIFISTPSGYLSGMRPAGETSFYQEVIPDKWVYDFVVSLNPKDDRKHTVVVTADPQVMDTEDLELMDIRVGQMIDGMSNLPEQYTFGICLGDIVGWNHGLYPEYQKIMDKTGLEFRHVIGNHDMTFDNVRSFEGSMKKYGDYFGPAWYSFNVGDVHYVVMNDNYYIGRQWFYIGYFDELQLRWLEKDLSFVPKDKKVVVCVHIPTTLSSEDRERFDYPSLASIVANKNCLYDILEPYDALILSGHIHTCTTQNLKPNLTEVNVGGFCGAWWCGDVCIDGSPAGYKVVEMDGVSASWKYYGCGYPEDYQMKIYVNDAAYPGQVIANVWDYDDMWKVEYFENGKKVCDMERFTARDPYAAEIFKDRSKYKISWVYAAETSNLFRASVSDKAKRIEVRATDRFGRVYREKFRVK